MGLSKYNVHILICTRTISFVMSAAAISLRQLGSLFCQMFSPVAVVIFLVLLQMIVRDEAEGVFLCLCVCVFFVDKNQCFGSA